MQRRVLWSWVLLQHTTDGTAPICYGFSENQFYSTAPRASVNTEYTQMGFISGPDSSTTYPYILPHTLFTPYFAKLLRFNANPSLFRPPVFQVSPLVSSVQGWKSPCVLRAILITVQRTTSPTALVGSVWLTKCDQLRDMTLLPARTDLTGIQLGPQSPWIPPTPGRIPPILWVHHSRSAAGWSLGAWGVLDEPPHTFCAASGLAWGSQVWGQGSWRWQ